MLAHQASSLPWWLAHLVKTLSGYQPYLPDLFGKDAVIVNKDFGYPHDIAPIVRKQRRRR